MANEIGESKYARKRRRGNMMYGPGCCGHRDPSPEVKKARQKRIALLRRTQPNQSRGIYYA